MKTTYPVTFSVDFPDRDLDRVSTAFRIFAVIPIGIILSLLSGASIRYVTSTNGTNETVTSVATGGGLLFLPLVLLIVFRQKYPRHRLCDRPRHRRVPAVQPRVGALGSGRLTFWRRTWPRATSFPSSRLRVTCQSCWVAPW